MSFGLIATGLRVYLRELEHSDWQSIYAYASNPDVVRFQAWGPHSEEDSKSWVNLVIQERSKTPRSMYYWGICLKENDELVGGVGIQRGAAETYGSAEIGYSLHPKYWHQGFGREAVDLMLKSIFEITNLHRLMAHCRDTNLASIRLLEVTGFRMEGHFLQDIQVRGQLMNSYWYALLRVESDRKLST